MSFQYLTAETPGPKDEDVEAAKEDESLKPNGEGNRREDRKEEAKCEQIHPIVKRTKQWILAHQIKLKVKLLTFGKQ